jgi:hypothetical protein
MHSTDHPDTREGYINALRALADYLAGNPAIPVPSDGTASVRVAGPTHGGCAQVDHIAALLGSPVEDSLTSTGYYQTRRDFGPIEYVAWTVTDVTVARNRAATSYWGCVTPDEVSSDA